MSHVQSETYALPLFEIDQETDYLEFVADTGDDAAENPNRIEIDITDHGQQNIVLRVEEYSHGDCIRRERFKVTDTQQQLCSYQGDTVEDLSLEVIWAVYLNGFAIENLDTYSQGLVDLKEMLAFNNRLRTYEQEYAGVPLVRRTVRDLKDMVAGIVQLLTHRYILGVDEYRQTFDQFEREQLGLSAGDVLDDEVTTYAMRAYEFARELSEERNVREQFSEDVNADEAGRFSEPASFSLHEHEEQGATYHHAFVFTERGAARYDFQKTGPNRGVYQRRRHGRPLPEAIQIIEEDEPQWEITNMGTTLTASSLDELVDTGMGVVEDIQDRYRGDGVWSMDLLCAKAMRQIGAVRFMCDVVETLGEEQFVDYYQQFTAKHNLPENADLQQVGSHKFLRKMMPMFASDEHTAVNALKSNNADYDENHEPLTLT